MANPINRSMALKQSLPTNTPPKLSVVAQFDDMCRFAESLMTSEAMEEKLIEFINKCEENRIQWLLTERELKYTKTKLNKSQKENQSLKNDLKRFRIGFTNELKKREEFKKQSIELRKQLNSIKEFVLNEDKQNETRDKVLSYIQLDVISEEHESDMSIDGMEYDNSEEDLLNDMNESFRTHLSAKPNDLNETKTQISRHPSGSNLSESQRNRSHSDPTLIKVDVIHDKPSKSESDANQCESNGPKVEDTRPAIPCHTSSPLLRLKSFRSTFLCNIPENVVKTTFEQRKHNLVVKRALKSIVCCVCDKSIGFIANHMICELCRMVCHIECRERLPIPCIPYQKPDGKRYGMSLIADFAPKSTRPMVPALIVHCCTEIERRGLREEGIYRKCVSVDEVQRLKEKLLKPKSGMPSLNNIDIHVLANVIKRFLRDLDEPLVTRLLWRDFVRAADQQNPELESTLILETLEQIPTSNSDSLAFLMKHLIQVMKNSNSNLMDSKSLIKIFGPTLVGYSMRDPPMDQILTENQLQMKVMEAFFRIPEEIWIQIINSSEISNSQTSNRSSRRSSCRRSSVTRGVLSPPPQRTSTQRSSKVMTLKPLF